MFCHSNQINRYGLNIETKQERLVVVVITIWTTQHSRLNPTQIKTRTNKTECGDSTLNGTNPDRTFRKIMIKMKTKDREVVPTST